MGHAPGPLLGVADGGKVHAEPEVGHWSKQVTLDQTVTGAKPVAVRLPQECREPGHTTYGAGLFRWLLRGGR
jgi:hypothetical protein